MTWDDVFKIALTAVGGIGGIALIIGCVIRFSADKIAERLHSKYQLKLDKELEGYKSHLENRNYLSRAMFEKEFAIYQDLITKFYEAYPYFELINGFENSGTRLIGKKELDKDNPDLLQLYTLYQDKQAITEPQLEHEREMMAIKMLEFKKAIGASGAFIPHDIQKLFGDIYDKCDLYDNGKSENEVSWNIVLAAIGKMQIELRDYLKSLIIVE